MRIRRIALVALAAATAGAAALLPVSQAHAADGTGYEMEWHYHDGRTFTYFASLPGATMYGSGTDSLGARAVTGWLLDDPNDNLCADAWFYENDGTFHQYRACNGDAVEINTLPDLGGEMTMWVLADAGPDNFVRYAFAVMPNSFDEPSITDSGNGISWIYTTPTHAHFTLQRQNAKMSGDTDEDPADHTFRNVSGHMIALAPVDCIYGGVDGDRGDKAETGCAGNGTFSGRLHGWLQLNVCERRPGSGTGGGNGQDPGPGSVDPCVAATIPLPQ